MGIIPAWAGKTPVFLLAPNYERAHPRMGGENVPETNQTTEQAGSSPHGRGKPDWSRESRGQVRLIPAWAGKTTPALTPSTLTAAHPHMGGENHARKVAKPGDKGSSPHGRGKHREGVSPP